MKNGLTYNYQGEEAAPGERILNRNDLTIFLLDLLASRFNRDDVNNILAGIDRGEAYNFEGKPARTGEPILEREILTRLLPVLEKSSKSLFYFAIFVVDEDCFTKVVSRCKISKKISTKNEMKFAHAFSFISKMFQYTCEQLLNGKAFKEK